MSTNPGQPGPPVVRRRRRHHRKAKGLKAIPKRVWITILLCVVIIIAIPIAGQQAWRVRRGSGYGGTRELVVSAATLDSACGCIRGVVSSASGKAFNQVQIFFELTGPNHSEAGTVLALVGVVRPHEAVKFATDAVPRGVTQYKLKEVKGIQ